MTLILLAVLMFAVTYPARVLPIAVPVLDKLPGPVLTYLRLVGPAVLTALAVVNSVVDDERALHLGSTALCVVVCVALVAWRRNLLLGLIVAIGLAIALRALGLD